MTILMAVALLASASCENRFEDNEQSITFNTMDNALDAEVFTKATALTALTQVNILCVTGTAGSAETKKWAADGLAVSSGKVNTGKFWPSSDLGYKFYGSNIAMTSASTGPTVSATNSTDVLCAVLTSPSFKQNNTLTFNHIFARLGNVNVSSATSGYTLSNVSIKLTPKTGGTYNLFQGNGKKDGTGWSNATNGTSTTVANASGDNANDIYLVPGQYELSATYTVTKGDYSYTQSTPKKATVLLEAGSVNAIVAKLPVNAATEISFTVTVTPWSSSSVTPEWN